MARNFPKTVAEAATHIDAVKPGWENWINRPISMGSCRDCPLGQVFGEYSDGLYALYGYYYIAQIPGVDNDAIDGPAGHPFNFSENLPAWEHEIATRKAAARVEKVKRVRVRKPKTFASITTTHKIYFTNGRSIELTSGELAELKRSI